MSTEPLKVCVVDDESRLRELLVREINAMGFSAIGFRCGEEALPVLETGEIDVAMLDLNLPGIGGMELFQRLHQKRPDLAIVVLTGFGALDSAVQALRWGAADYLTKPCSLDQIEAVLLRVDQTRRERLQAERIDAIQSESVPPPTDPAVQPMARKLEDLEREQILAAMEQYQGNKPKVAELLGISLRTLYNKLNAYRAQGRIK